MVRHHDPPHLVQRLGMRKQRRRMPIVAHPQQHQVERRRLRALQPNTLRIAASYRDAATSGSSSPSMRCTCAAGSGTFDSIASFVIR